MFVRVKDTLLNFDYVILVDPIYQEDNKFYVQMEVLSHNKREGRRYSFLDATEAQEMYDILEAKLCQNTSA